MMWSILQTIKYIKLKQWSFKQEFALPNCFQQLCTQLIILDQGYDAEYLARK